MRIACIATDMFEDDELTAPKEALERAGHEVEVVSPRPAEIKGKKGRAVVRPDRTIDAVESDRYDALFIPGGHSPDGLRADGRFVRFVQAFDREGKPIFAICHGAQLLLTADLLEGRRVTAWKTVQDDLRRAGIEVEDREVVVDGNLVTSRQPGDIPAFNRAIVEALAQRGRTARGAPASPGGPAHP